MIQKEQRPGGTDQGAAEDRVKVGSQHNPNGADLVALPVWSLRAALDHLDEAGLCCCWVARRRCSRRWTR